MSLVGILGVGKMGSAILNGLVDGNLYKKSDILLHIHNEKKREEYKNNGYNVTGDVNLLFKNARILILAIKPQMFDEVLKDAINYDFTNRCIISIAAGLSIEYISKFFKNGYIVRTMPNTPAQIGMGVSTICAHDEKNPFFNEAHDIFSSFGICLPIKEEQMDSALVLNGSMPAYLFYFAKCFIDYGIESGLDPLVCKKLTLETFISSANLALKSDETLDKLIDNVCSKGGTTIAGLDMLKENSLDKAVLSCAKACENRSKELSK